MFSLGLLDTDHVQDAPETSSFENTALGKPTNGQQEEHNPLQLWYP